MPKEPREAPMAGEPAADGSDTPAGGAADTLGSDGSAPQSQTPTPDYSRALDARFKAGYGKGAEKGRAEGAAVALEALGFSSLDEAAEAIKGWREQGEAPAPDVRQTPEYRELTKTHHRLTREHEKLAEEVGRLRAQADEARLDKIRALALAKGVGGGGQLEAFVRLAADRIRFDERQNLRVMEQVDGTEFPSDLSVETWIETFLSQNRFLLTAAPTPKGTGARQEPVAAPKADGPNYALFGVRPPKRAAG